MFPGLVGKTVCSTSPIVQVKARTWCAKCDETGHWPGDPECKHIMSQNRYVAPGKTSTTNFACVDGGGDEPDGNTDVCMVDYVAPFLRCQPVLRRQRRPEARREWQSTLAGLQDTQPAMLQSDQIGIIPPMWDE